MEGGNEKLNGGGSGSGQWSEDAIRVLIDSYTAKFMELQRSNLRQKDWQEVLATLSSVCGEGYNYSRCRNKLDSLKKKFKNVKNKLKNVKESTKVTPVNWKWYDDMEKLMERSSGGSSSLARGQGIPGGIASGEKLDDLNKNKINTTDEDGELSATNSADEDEEDDEGMTTETPSSFLFDARNNNGFLESGLNLALNGICQARNLSGSRSTTAAEAAEAEAAGRGTASVPGFPKVSEKTIRKRVKSSAQAINRQMKEAVGMVIEAMERMERNRLDFEHKRLEMIKELELKRNETNLQIARYIVESCMPRNFSFQAAFQEPPNLSEE